MAPCGLVNRARGTWPLTNRQGDLGSYPPAVMEQRDVRCQAKGTVEEKTEFGAQLSPRAEPLSSNEATWKLDPSVTLSWWFYRGI